MCHYLCIYLSICPICRSSITKWILVIVTKFLSTLSDLKRAANTAIQAVHARCEAHRHWHTSNKIITRGSAAVAPWVRKFVMPSSRNKGLTCASGTGGSTYSTSQLAHACTCHNISQKVHELQCLIETCCGTLLNYILSNRIVQMTGYSNCRCPNEGQRKKWQQSL